MVRNHLLCLFLPLPEGPDEIGCYHDQVDDNAYCEKPHGGIFFIMHRCWLSSLYRIRASVTGFRGIHHQ